MHNIDVIINPNQSYRADDLYRWNKFNTLTIYGLNFTNAPEIHFASCGMTEAIVKQSEMSVDGIITCEIPNRSLEIAGTLDVYVCNYNKNEFKSYVHFTLLVKDRLKPADFIADTDEKIYSYNALENLVNNTIVNLTRMTENAIADMKKANADAIVETKRLNNENIDEVNRLNAEHDKSVNKVIDAGNAKINEAEQKIVENNRIIEEAKTKFDDILTEVRQETTDTIDIVMDIKNGTTYFNDDGSISTLYVDGTSDKYEFPSDGSVIKTLDWADKGKRIVKTVFNPDGTITQTVQKIGGN